MNLSSDDTKRFRSTELKCESDKTDYVEIGDLKSPTRVDSLAPMAGISNRRFYVVDLKNKNCGRISRIVKYVSDKGN